MKKRKLKLKRKALTVFKIIGVIIVILIGIYLFYRSQINSISKLGYSEVASNNILFSGKKEFVLSTGENKTLNAAFESEHFNEKYLENYTKITYQDHKDLIKNINKLLDKEYSNKDVSIILSHGTNEDVCEFTKRERVKYLEEFYEFPYAKIKYYDRYIAYTDTTGEDEKTTVIHVNLNMDKIAYDDAVKVEEFSMDMLVNKYFMVDADFRPNDLMDIPEQYTDGEEHQANKMAVNALIQMFESAKVEGLEMVVNSSYRSYDDQTELIEFYRKWYGDNYVNKYVARLGHSEHQTGLAFDIASTSVNVFANSKEYLWMKDNAYKYGFIMRFYKGVETMTGFKSEPWHYRYVGKDIAKYIYDNNITLEEYYVMFLDKEK